MLNMEEYLKFLNQSDKTVQKALEVLEKGESFPSVPEQQMEATHEGTEKAIAQANQGGKKKATSRSAEDAFFCLA
jgi:carboxyl-terminal processing protease